MSVIWRHNSNTLTWIRDISGLMVLDDTARDLILIVGQSDLYFMVQDLFEYFKH